MDIFAHGLWAGASYKALQRNSKRPISVWLAAFWGVIPDLFAFSIPFAYMLFSVVSGKMSFNEFHGHTDIEPIAHDFPLSGLADSLYNISHSLVVFVLVFIAVALVRRKASWEMGGWLLHILIDIPTHTYAFFPTPFLWPISDFRVNGFAWGNPSFMAVNYTLIIVSFLVLYATGRKKRNL